MDYFTTVYNQVRQMTKIKTYECYTKFQEAQPAHRSNLVNKQLGYDSIIEPGGQWQPVKLKNCINSSRPNSELFKRFAKNFINNIKNDIDQLIFFTSMNPLSRIQTSIGLPTNPGLFLIIGLSYLDEKYKQSYQRCDVEFSFLQFRDSQMFDLICYTNQPLTPQRDANGKFVDFREHWTRATTFNQFIKLFKVALFNNKERDFKTDNLNGKYKSTFIMKIRNKLYTDEGELLRCQETVLIDFQSNCLKEVSINLKEKQGSKSMIDFVLMDIHNANPNNKAMHYHMVQQNYLLVLLGKFLGKNEEGSGKDERDVVGGHVMVINSIPAQVQSFHSCLNYLNNITSTIGDSWEAKVAPKPKTKWNLDHCFVNMQLRGIISGIALNTYSSLRNFNQYKQQLVSEVKRCKGVVRELRKAISSAVKLKMQLSFMKNQLIAFETKLIGSCIKSDHFKDFYNAKSYIQLQRQVAITTQSLKEEIHLKTKALEQAEKKFAGLRKRQTQIFSKYKEEGEKQHSRGKSIENLLQNTTNWNSYVSLQNTKQNWHNRSSGANKFKKISMVRGQTNQLLKLRKLIHHLNQHMFTIWDNYMLFEQRTTGSTLEQQGLVLEDQQKLMDAINLFVKQVDKINETDIMYEQDNNVYNNNQVGLFRSLNFLGLIGPKKNVNNYQVGKRLILKRGNDQKKVQSRASHPKLPSIHIKVPPVVITGNFKLADMLTNPKTSSDNNLASIRQ